VELAEATDNKLLLTIDSITYFALFMVSPPLFNINFYLFFIAFHFLLGVIN
jgi:hypothetical protein